VVVSVHVECDVGTAPGMFLFVLPPVLWMATSVLWMVVLAALGRYGAWVAVPVAIVLNVAMLWWLMAEVATPADYPDNICPANVPTWWPDFIPV
jgi:hypothetical protein